MNKRGQIAVFVVIGIVVLIIFSLVFVFRSEIVERARGQVNVEKQLQLQMDAVSDHINECMGKIIKKDTYEIAKGGGSFDSVNYVNYKGEKAKVLCQYIEGESGCLSNPVAVDKVVERLNEIITADLKSCIDLNAFRMDEVQIFEEDLELEIIPYDDYLVVELYYPITVKIGENDITKDKFVSRVNVPLVNVIKTANKVLKLESTIGRADPIYLSGLSYGLYEVQVRKPYPNKVYWIKVRGSDFEFMFSVKGEDYFE